MENTTNKLTMQPDYLELAKQILESLGGVENVVTVSHCATRLRVVLKDEQLFNAQKVDQIPEILGVRNLGKQIQIVIGPTVAELYAIAMKTWKA